MRQGRARLARPALRWPCRPRAGNDRERPSEFGVAPTEDNMQRVVKESDERFRFLDYLRFGAAWAVVWDHMLAQWPSDRGVPLRAILAVREYVTKPLGIIQDFGWMAVCIFFLVSGFIITHVSARETTIEFLVKRIFRIFPMLAAFVLIAVAISPGFGMDLTLGDILRSMLLVNYVSLPQKVVVGVALVIEVIFYVMMAMTMRLRRPTLAIYLNLLIVALIIFYSRKLGDRFFLFSASAAYVPYLVVGQVFYLGLHRRIFGIGAMVVALISCFAVLLYGLMSIHTAFLPVDNSYLINFVYACLIFCVFHQLNDRLRSGRAVRLLAASSFSVYLVHGTIGRVAFDEAWAHWGPDAALAAGLGVTVVATAAIHIFFEKPLLVVGRNVARRFSFQ
jgi:peptidoglycan/LPS O-acetylase OafA/YrhL